MRLYHALFGEQPRLVWLFLLPMVCGVLLDLILRHDTIRTFPWAVRGKYLASSLVSGGFWGGTLWLMALVDQRGSRLGRIFLGVFLFAFVLPFSFAAYGGQAVYFRVYNTYVARDTIRLGLELSGTVLAWATEWGGKFIPAMIGAVVMTALVVWIVRKAGPSVAKASPIVPTIALLASVFALWMDYVATKSLQAAPPDSCFLHGVAGLCRERLTQSGPVRGLTRRQPAPLPPLTKSEHPRNVILVITESVRADVLCSKKTEACASRFLDEVVPERFGLLKMTSQTSGTYTACMVLWTGLAPDADFTTVHKAPFLWEVAKAQGYDTGYFSAHNLRYRDLGVYLNVSGIDTLVSAAELGDMSEAAIGAPDEKAAQHLVDWARERKGPYFGVLHFSNTHWPYRVDQSLQPFEPHDPDPFKGIALARNHYKNSVLMQERTLAETFKQLKQLPSWDDTVVVFLSDHGEQFREHGGLYHLNTLYEEEVRVPGFVVAGGRALTGDQVQSLNTYESKRVYAEDLNATLLDLLGAFDARPRFPFAAELHGRSILRPPPSAEDPLVTASTSSGVWLDDNPVYGVYFGEHKIVGADAIPWLCYDMNADPRELKPVSAKKCPELLAAATKRWPMVPMPR